MNSIINKIKQIKKFKKSGDKLKEQNQQEVKTEYINMKFVRLATNAPSDKRKEVANLKIHFRNMLLVDARIVRKNIHADYLTT